MEGRTNDGRFAPGSAGGPGRKKGRKLEEYKKMLHTHVPEVLAVVVKLAKEGDLVACKLLLDRAFPAHSAMTQELEDQIAELRELVVSDERKAA